MAPCPSRSPNPPSRPPPAQAARSRAIIEAHDVDEPGQPSERWNGADPPPLERVLFHLLQEYARHVGHLDVVTELATGGAGE